MRAAPLVVCLCLAALCPATAGAYSLGLGDQRNEFFADPHFRVLHITKVRYTVAWDALSHRLDRLILDDWLRRARAHHLDVLLTFEASPYHPRRLPSPARFTRVFRSLRQRYPWVHEYATWSEPNLHTSPLIRRPGLAARYWKIMIANCHGCQLLAAEMLDTPSMNPWIHAFIRKARRQPRYWGLHDYSDANRFRFSGTRAMLRETRGYVWLTETGGLVGRTKRGRARHSHFPENPRHAGRVTAFLLTHLARVSRRITHLYLYQWEATGRRGDWDTGLLNRHGRPRPAYRVLRRYRLAHLPRARHATAAPPGTSSASARPARAGIGPVAPVGP